MKIILSGRGGQGIIFATRIITEAAFIENRSVVSSETHGMSQRGGSIISHIKIGSFLEGQIRKGTADNVICFNKNEIPNCIAYLKSSGNLFLNIEKEFSLPEEFDDFFRKNRIKVYRIDANRIAHDLCLLNLVNLITLGFSVYYWKDVLNKNSFVEAIEKVSSPLTIERNKKAFLAGYENAL